jgi:uncharacterized protein
MSVLPKVVALHRAVDQLVATLEERHRGRLNCRRGCSACCVDELTVFEVEADRIRSEFPDVLAQEDAGPVGMCAFLDPSGGCRVYNARPYVCRTQGLPLRWLAADDATGEIIEGRDICPLNADGEPIESLADHECWSLGAVEGRLARLQEERDGEELRRVALRSLFKSSNF